mmetsp:Transcript_30913/g.104106  ORF Transcript_30913/g.104106 Transcript_30913/m.104106 type:complete len:362 (-) Transcript_30913:245-1330(-)
MRTQIEEACRGRRGVGLGVRRGSVHDEIRVVQRLPQPREELEDVGVVVQDGALVHESGKPGLLLFKNAFIKVALLRRQLQQNLAHDQARQLQVRRALLLRPAEHDHVQNVLSEQTQRPRARARVARLLDGLQDALVKVVVVLHRGVAAQLAPRAVAAHRPDQTLAVAALLGAKVVGVGVDAQEADQRLQFFHAVLQRRAGEAPTPVRPESENRLGRARGEPLDSMRLVEDDSAPERAVEERAPQIDALDVLDDVRWREETALVVVHRNIRARGGRRVVARAPRGALWLFQPFRRLTGLFPLRPLQIVLRRRLARHRPQHQSLDGSLAVLWAHVLGVVGVKVLLLGLLRPARSALVPSRQLF